MFNNFFPLPPLHQLADFFEHLLQGVRAYMLGDLLKLPGDTFTSIYDLVDDWKHIVKLTDILPNRDDYTDGDYAWVLI